MGDTQWEELEGRPYTVAAKGRRYQEIAEAIQRSTSSLRAIEDEMGNTSLALDKTRKLAGDVRDSIEKARVRYQDTGEALETYGDALRTAKYDQADPAAEKLRTLRADLADAETAARSAQTALDDLPSDATPAETSAANNAASTAEGTVSGLRTQVTQYETQWQDGKDAKDSAARSAIEKIDEVVNGKKTNGLKDGFWDKVGEIAAGIYKVFKIICDIAGILAIFLSWVPILGQILLVLAAIGSLLAIIEGIVKIARDGFSWGALIGIGLGVMGLFGGRAIGALAKYAKARSVVQTASRMSPQAAKLKFGSTLLKSSRRTFAMTPGQRVTDVLKSPFLRSSTDKAIAGLAKNGELGKALSTWRGAQFPLPYKDGAMRFAVGNGDVADMLTHFSQTGLHIDNVTSNAQAIASVAAVTHQMANLGNNMYKLGTDINGGNAWGAADTANSVVTQPAGGAWGNITGIPMKVNSWFGG